MQLRSQVVRERLLEVRVQMKGLKVGTRGTGTDGLGLSLFEDVFLMFKMEQSTTIHYGWGFFFGNLDYCILLGSLLIQDLYLAVIC